MRQQVEIVAAVHFDAPAELSRSDLQLALADALLKGTHATAEPQRVRVLSLREEAALFNNNGDQWSRKGLTLSLAGVEQFRLERLGYTDDEALRASSPGWARDGSGQLEKCAVNIADALNMWAARVAMPTLPPPPEYVGPVPQCAECGNDGSNGGLYVAVDARWNPAAKVWELQEREDSGGSVWDCTSCDHQTPTHGKAALFPYGLQLRPDGEPHTGKGQVNAELLGAVKDLLAALEARGAGGPAMDSARAAIAKAEASR